MLLDDAMADSDVVVADLGALTHAVRGIFRRFDCVVLVGLGDPVGVGRMVRARASLADVVDPGRIICVANRVPPRPYYRSEIAAVLDERLDGNPWALVPDDKRLVSAAWDGVLPAGGTFRKSMGLLSRPILHRISDDD
jgi:CO dehydrogenase nickel-insertion accessory protein CooC1